MSMQRGGGRRQPPQHGPGSGGPMGGLMRGGEKAKDFRGTMGKMLRYLRRYWVPMAVVLVFAVVSTIFSIWTPRITGDVTNDLVGSFVQMSFYDEVMKNVPGGTLPAGTTGGDVLAMIEQTRPEMYEQVRSGINDDQLAAFQALDMSRRPTIDFDAIGRTMLFLIGLYVLSAAFSYTQGFVMAGISQKVSYTLRKSISEKINRLPLRYFDRTTHGDVLSRVTNDVDTVAQTLNMSLSQLITSIVSIVGVAVMMFSISWQLTLVALATAPLSFAMMGLIVGRSQRYFKEQQNSLGELNGHIEETFSGHSVVKVFGAEKRKIREFGEINGKLYGSAWKSQFFSGLMMPVMSFIGNLGYVGVCLVGGVLAVNGQVMVGDIQAFIQYLRLFTQPITQLATVANTLQSTAAAAERVFGFLEEAEETPESETPVSLENVRGDVVFDDVVFGYEPDKTIIGGFSSSIHAGQKVAIVGPTGAGKTTMVNLLMRFYDVDSGSIAVDGADIRDMRRADVRRLFGMVLQDTWLFNGTLRENVSYSKPDVSEEELWRVLRAAQVDHFINALPEGLNTELNEEASNISQGQRQLLTIARAMLADPPMLILDEATSSVDTRTEVLIKRAMDNLMQGRTSFIIAHRLSTIRDADLILVMRDGNIVEQGAHEELLRLGGFYAELYNSQFARVS